MAESAAQRLELPDGRTVDPPACPTCRATGLRCLRPSGHEADVWHDARETALAQLCRCDDVCLPWLADHPLQLDLMGVASG